MIAIVAKRFVVSLITRDNDYQMEQAAAAEEVARHLGIQLKVVFADSSSIQQSQQLLECIQRTPELRPDGIVLEPAGGTALPQVARVALEAGIGWVVLNRAMTDLSVLRSLSAAPSFALAQDNLEVGRVQGRQVAALLPQAGTALYIQGPPETETAKLRHAGIQETKPSGVHMMTIRGQWTEDSANEAVIKWLLPSTSRRIRIDLVVAQNDAMAVGARMAFRQHADFDVREHSARLLFLGVDGLRKTGRLWVESGILAATVVTPPLAGTALEMLVEAIRTARQPPEFTLIEPSSYPALESLQSRYGTKSARLKKTASVGLD
jgi:ribose transport system substrate-binding protein